MKKVLLIISFLILSIFSTTISIYAAQWINVPNTNIWCYLEDNNKFATNKWLKIDKKAMHILDEFFTQNNEYNNKNYAINRILYSIKDLKIFTKEIEDIIKKYRYTNIYKNTKKNK